MDCVCGWCMREIENIQYKSRLSSYIFAFAILRLRLKRKTHLAFRVLNVFYFQTDFNLRFKRKRDLRLTCKRAFDASYIAHYSLKCLCTLHRILSLKWISPAVSETKTETETKPTKRSQITDQNLRFKRARPIRCGPRQLAPAGLRTEQECVKDMLSGGQIEPSDSPWASPVVLVTKKDGSTRFCVEY